MLGNSTLLQRGGSPSTSEFVTALVYHSKINNLQTYSARTELLWANQLTLNQEEQHSVRNRTFDAREYNLTRSDDISIYAHG